MTYRPLVGLSSGICLMSLLVSVVQAENMNASMNQPPIQTQCSMGAMGPQGAMQPQAGVNPPPPSPGVMNAPRGPMNDNGLYNSNLPGDPNGMMNPDSRRNNASGSVMPSPPINANKPMHPDGTMPTGMGPNERPMDPNGTINPDRTANPNGTLDPNGSMNPDARATEAPRF